MTDSEALKLIKKIGLNYFDNYCGKPEDIAGSVTLDAILSIVETVESMKAEAKQDGEEE